MVFVTILHAGFTDYLPAGDRVRQAEWAKVQGRFQDVVFNEPPEQMLRLVGQALDTTWSPQDRNRIGKTADRVIAHLRTAPAEGLRDLLINCAPLHPATALLLWPLFRGSASQNERSLFSFLTSHERDSFTDFLQTAARSDLFPIDRLYDYVDASLGVAVRRGQTGHRWAELDESLAGLPPNAPPLVPRVLKTVGLLSLFGRPGGIAADRDTLATCLCEENLDEAISWLEQKSSVVYRRFESAYGIWEGSDFDLEKAAHDALNRVRERAAGQLLSDVLDLTPLVARRHYFETGTLRVFDVVLWDGTTEGARMVREALETSRDGVIVFILTHKPPEGFGRGDSATTQRLFDVEPSVPIVWALPKPIAGLREAADEVAAWRSVLDEQPELQSDRVARREVRARLSHAEARLRQVAGETFGLRGQILVPQLSRWFHDGKQVRQIESARDFHQWLSQVCDKWYPEAPRLQNELLNRDQLSSAAAAARNTLIKMMANHENEQRLGIAGSPAEASMYDGLLKAGGFHRKRSGQYAFGKPNSEWMPVWKKMEEFLKSTRDGRRPLCELYEELKRPPLGLRNGPLPVLLVAMLLFRRDDIVLYQQGGTIIPELRDEVLELLVRNPDTFEIQQYRFGSGRQALINKLAEYFAAGSSGRAALLEVVRGLVSRVAKLPRYSRNTRKVSPEAIAIREVLLRATDPQKLIFDELPDAAGIRLEGTGSGQPFADGLAGAVTELERAFPSLLDRLEQQLRDQFQLIGSSESARDGLRDRALRILPHVSDRDLTLFVRTTAHPTEADWRERTGRAVLGGAPVEHWTDREADEFQVRLRQLRSEFVRVEELAAEHGEAGGMPVLRLGLLNGSYQEGREILTVSPSMLAESRKLAQAAAKILSDSSRRTDREVRLLALGLLFNRELDKPLNFDSTEESDE